MATGKAAPEDRLRKQEAGGKIARTASGRQRDKDGLDITVGESSLRKHTWVATAILKTEPSQSDQTRRHRPSTLDPGLIAGHRQPKTQSGLAFREDTYKGWLWASHTTRLRYCFQERDLCSLPWIWANFLVEERFWSLKRAGLYHPVLVCERKKVEGNTGTKTWHQFYSPPSSHRAPHHTHTPLHYIWKGLTEEVLG